MTREALVDTIRPEESLPIGPVETLDIRRSLSASAAAVPLLWMMSCTLFIAAPVLKLRPLAGSCCCLFLRFHNWPHHRSVRSVRADSDGLNLRRQRLLVLSLFSSNGCGAAGSMAPLPAYCGFESRVVVQLFYFKSRCDVAALPTAQLPRASCYHAC